MALAAVRSKAVVLLLLTCLFLLPFWESVNVLCFVVRYFMSLLVLLDGEERELVALLSLSSWCLLIVVLLFLAVPWVCSLGLWYFLIILTYFFSISIICIYTV